MDELYSHRQPSSYIEKEQPEDILNDLTTLMKNKKERRILEEGTSVYKMQPKTMKREKALEGSTLAQQMNKRIRELEEILDTRKGKRAERVEKNQMKSSNERPQSKRMSYNNTVDIPPSPFKHPCHKCEDRLGTDR